MFIAKPKALNSLIKSSLLTFALATLPYQIQAHTSPTNPEVYGKTIGN